MRPLGEIESAYYLGGGKKVMEEHNKMSAA